MMAASAVDLMRCDHHAEGREEAVNSVCADLSSTNKGPPKGS
jgi:hypothetical protein